MSITYLKVKIVSLAAEARIIRKLERNHRRMSKGLPKPQRIGRAIPDPIQVDEAQREHHRATWLGLKSHRRVEVRSAARQALLAYGYLRGMPYRRMEEKCNESPNWIEVAKNVARFSEAHSAPIVGHNRVSAIIQDLIEWSKVEIDLAKAA